MIDRELIMETLLARLTRAPAVALFTADLAAGDVTLSGISDTSMLRVGMPVGILDPNATGIVPGTVIKTLEPNVTLSIAPFQSGGGVALVQGFLTTSRKYQEPRGTYPHPAFFLIDWDEDYPADHGLHARHSWEPGIVTLMALGHIHALPGEEVPASVANRLLQSLEEALEPSATALLGPKQTLDLLAVEHATIEGRILKDAHEDDYVVYKVPFVIQVAQGQDVIVDPDPL